MPTTPTTECCSESTTSKCATQPVVDGADVPVIQVSQHESDALVEAQRVMSESVGSMTSQLDRVRLTCATRISDLDSVHFQNVWCHVPGAILKFPWAIQGRWVALCSGQGLGPGLQRAPNKRVQPHGFWK